jgi:alanine dehydrogenase
MLVGLVTRIKPGERRCALTPAGARELTAAGHDVLVQAGAGDGSGFCDADYAQAGAQLAPDAAIVWAGADLLLKVKEPIATEYGHLRAGQVLFTYLHLAADPALTDALIASGTTALAYETIEDADGRLPLLAPMSEIAGRLAAQAGAYFLQDPLGGGGVLVGGVPGVAAARITVLGGGMVGTHAARVACGMGAEVTILDRSLRRLRELDELFDGRARAIMSTSAQIEEELERSDVVIGAVLIPGAAAPKLVSREMLGLLPPRAVLVTLGAGWLARALPAHTVRNADGPDARQGCGRDSDRDRSSSVQPLGKHPQPLIAGRVREPPVPGCNAQLSPRQQQRRRQVQRVEAPQGAGERERGGALSEVLVDLDDAERRPLLREPPHGRLARHQADGARGLDEADAAHEPPACHLHRRPNRVAARLRDVPLHQRTRIEVEDQRSSSRSASTSSEADRPARASRGARVGRARAGGTTRPRATSARSASSPGDAPAGTMSATGRPRTVTRTCSPWLTRRSTPLSVALSSRTPISCMWSRYQERGHIPWRLRATTRPMRRATPARSTTCEGRRRAGRSPVSYLTRSRASPKEELSFPFSTVRSWRR